MNLIIERGKTVPFESLPPKSIALDGYVQGPAIDTQLERYSFDHHAGCIRLVTTATCRQVLDALLLGLNPDGFNIYINDVDGDSALSVWLLRNPKRAVETKVRELVGVVSDMDAHGPSYPILNLELGQRFYQGAMKAERQAKQKKTYATCNLESLLKTCLEGIETLLSPEGITLSAQPERHYTITHQHRIFIMVQSPDKVFDLIYQAGHPRAILYDRLPDGSFNYTIGKKSEFVSHFPIGPGDTPNTLLYHLNEIEPGWGGGSTIGGAPRHPDGRRSQLTPDNIFGYVQNFLKKRAIDKNL